MTNLHPLILPMAAHLGLTVLLYAMLTGARAPTAWGVGLRPDGSNPWAKIEPRISANLSNQFEWPMFFYVICLVLLGHDSVAPLQIGLAWTFVVGRFAHSYVQVMTTNIRLRGMVFTINFLAVLGMWVLMLGTGLSNAPAF